MSTLGRAWCITVALTFVACANAGGGSSAQPPASSEGTDAGASDGGAASTPLVPLFEWIHLDPIDVAYDTIASPLAAKGYRAAALVGLVFPPTVTGAGRTTVFRCAGETTTGPTSFYTTDRACSGYRFIEKPSTVAAFTVFANDAADAPSDALPLRRYALASTTVLSTVAPDADLLTVMRYTTDGSAPLGSIRRADAHLDANARWMRDYDQRACFGIDAYQTTCPPASGETTWTLVEPTSGTTLLRRVVEGRSDVQFTGAELSALGDAGGAMHSNRPLLLTVERGGALVAAKEVRWLRTPWIAQYDNSPTVDDDGARSFLPTRASALLVSHQRTAHRVFSDPFAARVDDPALFDGILQWLFQMPQVFIRGNYPARDDATVAEEQRTAFAKLDAQGVLVFGEAIGSYDVMGGYLFPFDDTLREDLTDPAVGAAHASIAAESFDATTGSFVPRTGVATSSKNAFLVDLTNEAALSWLESGAKHWMKRMLDDGVALAGVSFSELSQQGADADVPPPWWHVRIDYRSSPTFSASAAADFAKWAAIVGSPCIALPLLPDDYAAAAAHYASDPSTLARVASTPATSTCWGYWSIWRDAVFMRAATRVAHALKSTHDEVPYTRSPFIVTLYDHPMWTVVQNTRWYPLDDLGTHEITTGIAYDPAMKTMHPSLGMSFDSGWSFDPTRGGFDDFVLEIKSVDDATTHELATKMTDFRAATHGAAHIGMHFDLEYPQVGADYTNANLAEVFPDDASFRAPRFDLIWAWEAQCEYLLSMKSPDPGDDEQVSVDPAAPGVVTMAGGYAPILAAYDHILGPPCMFRHVAYNLAKSADSTGAYPYRPGVADGRPQSMLAENVRRALDWRRRYVQAQ